MRRAFSQQKNNPGETSLDNIAQAHQAPAAPTATAATKAMDASAAPRATANALLDAMQFRADPLADETIASILGPWNTHVESNDAATLIHANAQHFIRIREANRLIAQWTHNGCLIDWRAMPTSGDHAVNPEIARPLEAYVQAARVLPDWADAQKIERAETLFIEYGVLSCLLLFCASLPECYVLPDLADVLHIAGQLEKHTEYRVRSTAAMIFPVMMRGGLTASDGAGVSQVLKVRLIHATIRNLILRGNPEAAVRLLSENGEAASVIAPLTFTEDNADMHHALFAHGWDIGGDELPCNQEELAYTLLTFNFVFLRGLRTLGLALPPEDEDAYLHCWNVMAHVLGVERSLMPQDMVEAEKMFCDMQARGRADTDQYKKRQDPRPKLGVALMKSMEDVIPFRLLKGFPSLLTEHLCGKQTARDIGIVGRASFLSKVLFVIVMVIVRCIDTVVRWFVPQFSLSRMFSRVLGYQLMCKLLMDQTRPLKLPAHLSGRIANMMSGWGNDPKAPKWVNTLEDCMTERGPWRDLARKK
jgi:ER-bound oxygenase mpaB/B'/Rubber oxygenase, catalytic domain